MKGKITKAISGFYYVESGNETYECKAKGIFRKNLITPLVGDFVEFDAEDNKKGNIIFVEKRRNELVRPPISNVDMAVIVVASRNPEPSRLFIDKQIVFLEYTGIKPIICINKIDSGELDDVKNTYSKIGYEVILTSIIEDIGIEELKNKLKDKISVLVGNSGVGKSSLLNKIVGYKAMIEGDLSKDERGKQTTRHTELIKLDDNTYIADSPGFSSFDLSCMKGKHLDEGFIEFNEFKKDCRYRGCSHILEDECGIKKAIEEGKISKSRYEGYVEISKEQGIRHK